ncbi:50S ribosomal protein L32 [Candidatus Dependentiae bacterium]|nr:50S ribosomal protein L32 [Candidatus Dependentiae bacterium]
MPVPKRKTSKRRRNQRHANNHLHVATITHCPNTGSPVMPHTVCLESGFYKGVKVMRTKQDRLEARGKKRESKKAQTTKSNKAAQEGTQES